MLLALAVTPMRKLAALCEFFGVRTALHGPGDCSPVGMMANLAIDLSVSNFGIQECKRPHLRASVLAVVDRIAVATLVGAADVLTSVFGG